VTNQTGGPEATRAELLHESVNGDSRTAPHANVTAADAAVMDANAPSAVAVPPAVSNREEPAANGENRLRRLFVRLGIACRPPPNQGGTALRQPSQRNGIAGPRRGDTVADSGPVQRELASGATPPTGAERGDGPAPRPAAAKPRTVG